MGFEDEVVSGKLTGLLETYGKDGWVFIESDSYKVLIETILEEQKGGPKELAWEANNDGGAGSSTKVPLVAVPTLKEMAEEAVRDLNNIDLHEMPNTEETDGDHGYYFPGYQDDVEFRQPNADEEGQADGKVLESQLRKRKPCYGWICDDSDDDNEIIMLPPATTRSFSKN